MFLWPIKTMLPLQIFLFSEQLRVFSKNKILMVKRRRKTPFTPT